MCIDFIVKIMFFRNLGFYNGIRAWFSPAVGTVNILWSIFFKFILQSSEIVEGFGRSISQLGVKKKKGRTIVAISAGRATEGQHIDELACKQVWRLPHPSGRELVAAHYLSKAELLLVCVWCEGLLLGVITFHISYTTATPLYLSLIHEGVVRLQGLKQGFST